MKPPRPGPSSWLRLPTLFVAPGVTGTAAFIAVALLTSKLWFVLMPPLRETSFGIPGENAGVVLGGGLVSLVAGLAAGFGVALALFARSAR